MFNKVKFYLEIYEKIISHKKTQAIAQANLRNHVKNHGKNSSTFANRLGQKSQLNYMSSQNQNE